MFFNITIFLGSLRSQKQLDIKTILTFKCICSESSKKNSREPYIPKYLKLDEKYLKLDE